MTRYFTRPRAYIEKPDTDRPRDWMNDAPLVRDVHVPDHVATDTGILDHNGDCIMRAPNPVGFIW